MSENYVYIPPKTNLPDIKWKSIDELEGAEKQIALIMAASQGADFTEPAMGEDSNAKK